MTKKRTKPRQPTNRPTRLGRRPHPGRSPQPSAIRNPQSKIQDPGDSAFRIPHSAFGYTLIEIMVVVVIVVILMGITIPAISSVWGQRKEAEAESIVTGLLATTRAAALNDKERGLFFMLDDNDEQKVFRIEAAAYDPTPYPDVDPGGIPLKDRPDDDSPTDQNLNANATADRFVISGVTLDPAQALPNFKVQTLPAPYRVTPRGVVDSFTPADPLREWSPLELSRPKLDSAPGDAQLQRQRNFFAVIFSPDGRLVHGRDVLIYDPDYNGDTLGDRTGLPVGDVTTWYDGMGGTPSIGGTLAHIVEDTNTALNFRGVDGLLVYDDAAFAEQPDDTTRRQYLLDHSQPLFISPLSGQVLRGPRGENE